MDSRERARRFFEYLRRSPEFGDGQVELLAKEFDEHVAAVIDEAERLDSVDSYERNR